MSVYLREGIWYIDFTRLGRRYRRRGSRDKRAAEQMERNMLVDIDKNNAGLPTDITVAQLIEEYLRHSKATKRESTYILDNLYVREFGATINTGLKLSQIVHSISRVLDDDKAAKLSGGKNPFTLNVYIRTVKAMFNQAFKWNYLSSNPLIGFKLAKVMKTPRIRLLSDEEIQDIVELCDQELKDIVMTFVHSGLRAGELLFLEWQDIDFEQNVIKVQDKDVWMPKTYERREIPIHPELKSILFRRRQVNNKGFVFCKDSGNRDAEKRKRRPTQGSTYRILMRKYKKVLKEAGIKDAGLHTLRHTFGSHCVMAGIDLPTISKFMGHSDIKTTMIYVHLSSEHMQSSILKLGYGVDYQRTKLAALPCESPAKVIELAHSPIA